MRASDFGETGGVILGYEAECRRLIADEAWAREVRALRVDSGYTWRGVADECRCRWGTNVGEGDLQILGETLCHVAAELLGEDPDAAPWN